MHSRGLEMILSSHAPLEWFEPHGCRESRIAAAISRRQSLRSNPRFAILQSAGSRMFLRVISNAISSRVWPGREGGRARMFRGRRRVVGLPAIMRSSVFRCRSASPYRYVSSPCRSSLSLSLLPPFLPRHPRDPPTTHLAPLGDQMASPIRVIPNILFLFRNQISRRPSRSRRNFTTLFLSLFSSAEDIGGIFRSQKTLVEAIRSWYS